MRNTNKYTKLYSGGTPVFVEDNVFEIVIPMENVAQMQVGPNGTQVGTQVGTQSKIIELIKNNPKITRKIIAEELSISVRSLQRILNEMNNIHYVGKGRNGYWKVDEE